MDVSRPWIEQRVDFYHTQQGNNCAVLSLKIFSELFEFSMHDQVVQAASAMNGSGRFGAQCGLVEGMIMFLGVYGTHRGVPYLDILGLANRYAASFTARFGSLVCRDLRPQGFGPEVPKTQCHTLIVDAVEMGSQFLRAEFSK